MKVVILCGGQGTRIRDVAENLPKPLVQVGGYPIVWHIMKYYAHFGHTSFVLCLGYKGQAIKDFFLNYEAHTRDFTIRIGVRSEIAYHEESKEMDWQVTLAETGADAMTGARIKRIQKYIGNDADFMLTYGDGVGNVNLDLLAEFHRSHGKLLTVTGVRPPSRFGEIRANDHAEIVEFNEKPQTSGGRISGGFFACRREIFDYLEDRDDLVFESEPVHRVVADGQMMMFRHDGFWQPMDTYRDYVLLNELWEKREAPWKAW